MTQDIWRLQVDGLFQELDQILPNNFMSQTFEDSSASPISARPPASNLTQAQLEVGCHVSPHSKNIVNYLPWPPRISHSYTAAIQCSNALMAESSGIQQRLMQKAHCAAYLLQWEMREGLLQTMMAVMQL